MLAVAKEPEKSGACPTSPTGVDSRSAVSSTNLMVASSADRVTLWPARGRLTGGYAAGRGSGSPGSRTSADGPHLRPEQVQLQAPDEDQPAQNEEAE